jgi:hypothetical protein
MGSSIRAGVVVLLGLAAPGCVVGHLAEAARRWERPVGYQAASIDGEQLRLAYTALVTTDAGTPLGRRERRSAVALADLRAPGVPIEAVRVVPLPDGDGLGGTPLALVARDGGHTPFPVLEVTEDGAGPTVLLLRDGDGPYMPLYANVLTRRSTAPWAYPLVPFALAVDAVVVPVLIVLAPVVLLSGD